MVSGPEPDANLKTASSLIKKAADDGARLIQLPENFYLMGLEEQDKLKAAEPFGDGPVQDFLSDQAKRHKIWLIGGTAPIKAEQAGKISPASLVYNPDGELNCCYNKMHLFDVCADGNEETYQESSTFEAGTDIVVAKTALANIGMSVCYDLRFPELYREMLSENIQLISAPAAFTWTTGKQHWETLLKARAIENLCYVLAANQGGLHINGRKTFGHSMVLNPWGEILACVESGEGYAIADIDLEQQQLLRKQFPALNHRKITPK